MAHKHDVQFSRSLLKWSDQHGRKSLPWQLKPTPYRIWVSEIMLQQTQVTTVIPYFLRFMERFPTVRHLAQAKQDDVLHMWTGLGYYARGRNLHKAAQYIEFESGGTFPKTVEAWMNLPGIGLSTAGAICAFAYQQQATILDGNVKRVLCRYHAIDGWPNQRDVHDQLWDIATRYTPSKRVEHYTQAIMDLGAMVCTRSKPKCDVCPLLSGCQAYASNTVKRYPSSKPKKAKPVKATHLMMIANKTQTQFLMHQRPSPGIWGGLWSFPECHLEDCTITWCETHLSSKVHAKEEWTPFRHTFTHYHLDISPTLLTLTRQPNAKRLPDGFQFLSISDALKLGLPAPIKALLTALA